MCNCSAKCGYNQVVAIWISLTHIFRKANDTITTIYLHQNKIGDDGAVALAESLKATLVTCILQVHVSIFLWQV